MKQKLKLKRFLKMFAKLIAYNRTSRAGPYQIYREPHVSEARKAGDSIAWLFMEFLEEDLKDRALDSTDRLRTWLMAEIDTMRKENHGSI